jgi:SAM-dependent MidA family methyltransferase
MSTGIIDFGSTTLRSDEIVAGYGQKQNDDLLHNYTVAKITADCDFSEIWVTTKNTRKREKGTYLTTTMNQFTKIF